MLSRLKRNNSNREHCLLHKTSIERVFNFFLKVTLERSFNPKRGIKSNIDGCGRGWGEGTCFFGDVAVLMGIKVSACQGEEAGGFAPARV